MHIDADTLLARIRQDFPTPYELSLLRTEVDMLERENDALKAAAGQPAPFAGSVYAGTPTSDDGVRHGI